MKKNLLIAFLFIGFKGYACNVYDTIQQTICPEDSLLFNGVYLKTAGIYYDTINISLGCDTFRTLNLSLYPTVPFTIVSDSFCLGYSYIFNSKAYSTAGIHYDTFNSKNGCDSIVALSLSYKNRPVVFPPPKFTSIDSICIKDTVFFEGKKYKFNTSGLKTIRDTLFGGAANGCDSINMRVVFVRNNNGPNFVATKYGCTNKPFVIGDSSFTTSGPKIVVLENRFGCDSTIIFTLLLRSPSTTTLNRTTCSAQPYFFMGQYWGGNVTKDSVIVVVDNLTQTANAPGFGTQKCDSVVTLNLTVYPTKYTTIDTSLCENHTYYFKGQYLKTPGVYKDTHKTYHNCDSIITLNILAPRLISNYTYYRKFCSNEYVYFNNTNINQPGIYKDTLTNSAGCDSFLTMVLSKDTAYMVTINQSICSYDSILFGGKYYNTAGTYTSNFRNKYGCDSMVTLNLSVYPFRTITLVRSTLNNLKTDSGYKAYYWYFNEWTQLNATGHTLVANTTGSYHVIAQDSNNCKFKSNVYVYNPARIEKIDETSIQIYPVPSDNLIFIEIPDPKIKIQNVQLLELNGRKINSVKLNKGVRYSLDMTHLPQGVYILKLDLDGQSIERRIEKR